jgi:hypothetical protein
MSDYTPEDKEEVEEEPIHCPECQSDSVVIAGHCLTCMTCGFSLCSL